MINSLRFASGPAGFTFLLIAGAFVTGPALADTVKAEIGTPLPTYKVLSNGSSYHQVQGNIGSVDFSGEQPVVTLAQEGNLWYLAPMLDAAPGSNTLIAGAIGQSPVGLASYDVSSGAPVRTAYSTDAG